MMRYVMPKKSASAKVTTLVAGLALVIAVGLIAYQPLAQAVSLKQLSEGVQSPGTGSPGAASGTISFFLGEDGAIWYTVINTGAGASNKTGNSGNPFDQATTVGAPSGTCTVATQTALCNGFVSTALADFPTSCTTTTDTCAGIYAKVPGVGTFKDSPTVQSGTPIATGILNILSIGLDKGIWYTLFDIAGTGTTTSMGAGVPGKDPFSAAKESGNTGVAGSGNGFAELTTLTAQSIILGRINVGIWVSFP